MDASSSPSIRVVPRERASAFLAVALLGTLLVTGGCGSGQTAPSDGPALESRADSLAMQMYEAGGGPEVWNDVPALAFTFAVGQDSSAGQAARREVARHWWRRSDGAYRVQWRRGPDSTYTAVFNVNDFAEEPPLGRAMLNGTRLDSVAEKRVLRQARQRFANDTYWLLAPFKLFDEGVNRSIGDDPAQEGRQEALHLTFDRVGITPQDRYWLMADSTGRLVRWTFDLQGMGPEQAPGVFRWTDYETFSTPAGPLTLSTRKENVKGPQVVYTDEIRTPAQLPDSLFSIGGG